jgi:hypothetical protein
MSSVTNGKGTTNYIPDGYTLPVYFKEIPGVHGEFRGRFRPLILIQQGQVQRELSTCDEDWEKRQWVAARWITQQLVDWDIKKPNGQSVDHKDVNEVMRLRPTLFNRLWNVINNQDGGDIDPQLSAYDTFSRAAREQAVANQSGQTVEQVLEGN